jgi:hypothetical protein
VIMGTIQPHLNGPNTPSTPCQRPSDLGWAACVPPRLNQPAPKIRSFYQPFGQSTLASVEVGQPQFLAFR